MNKLLTQHSGRCATQVRALRLFWGILLASLLFGCVAPPSLPIPITPQPPNAVQPARTIVVVGDGTMRVQADVVHITFGIDVVDESVFAANRAASETVAHVLETLASLSVAQRDVRPIGYNIFAERAYPDYERDDPGTVPLFPGANAEIRYRVIHQITVIVRDLDQISTVVGALAASGGDRFYLYATDFLLDDPDALETEARAKAVADAQRKAEEIAQHMGAELGPPIAISEFVVGVYNDFAPHTPLWPGQLRFYKQLQIEYSVMPVVKR